MKILIVTPEPPTMLKVRVFRFARLLSTVHQVHIASVHGIAGRHASPEIAAASDRELRDHGVELTPLATTWAAEGPAAVSNYASGLPWRVARYSSPGLRRRMSALIDRVRPDLIHLDRLRAYPLAADWTGPLYIDMTDPIGWYFHQLAASAPLTDRLFLHAESRRMWSYECSTARTGKLLLFASDLGARLFLERCPSARATVVPVPVPVAPADDAAPLALPGARPAICFPGNLYYPPNVGGIEWFCRCCWPEVRARIPGATLHIAGSHPADAVRRLQSLDGVHLHCDPVRMDRLLHACDIAIAPLHLCAGFPNKIVDSAILGGLPVVASPAAVAGLPAPVREQLVPAATPRDWLNQIEQLATDPALRAQRAASLGRTIRTHLNDDLVLGAINRVIEMASPSETGSPAPSAALATA